jgi:hypothetical protein
VLNALPADVGGRTQRVLRQDGSRLSISAVHLQAALVLFDVQTARATKQWDLRMLTSRPDMEAARSRVVVRRSPFCRSADWYPTTCRLGAALARPQLASEMSAAEVAQGRDRPCHLSPGTG